MKKDNHIEAQIWNYIDNACTSEERVYIESRIRTKPDWKETYEELLLLHNKLNALTPEEPSFRFTQNVMDEVNQLKHQSVFQYYLNKYFLSAVGWFFIISISTLLIYSLVQIDWNFSSSNSSQYTLPKVDWNKVLGFLNLTISVKIFIVIDILLGLVLLDKYLYKKQFKLN